MLVRDIMTQPVKSVRVDATLEEAIDIMGTFNIGALPVCDNEGVVGIVTDRDILIRGIGQKRPPATTKVGEVMTPRAVTIVPNQTAEVAAQRLGYHGFRRLPVVDDEGRLVGILTADDIARQAGGEFVGVMARRIASQEPAAV